MTNSAGDLIEEFYENKKQEAKESDTQKKKIVKLLFEKAGDLCSVDVDGHKLVGEVRGYYLERVGDIERMQIELEVMGE